MSAVEGRADIKDLLLEVYFKPELGASSDLRGGGGQFSGAKRMRTGGPGSYPKSSIFSQEKPTCGFGECPLWMEERTLSIGGSRSAFDPTRSPSVHRSSGKNHCRAAPALTPSMRLLSRCSGLAISWILTVILFLEHRLTSFLLPQLASSPFWMDVVKFVPT
jgi:hypothetical protein